MKLKVIKRDGREKEFEDERISLAIKKAYKSVFKKDYNEMALEIAVVPQITSEILSKIKSTNKDVIHVEEIQDIVIEVLVEHNYVVAREYQEYRTKRNMERNKVLQLAKGLITQQNKDLMNENANKDAKVIPIARNIVSGIVAKEFSLEFMIPNYIAKAHKLGFIHMHDLTDAPFYPMFNCMLIDFKGLLEKGFRLGNAEIETPNGIETASAISTQIVAQVSSHVYGGTTFADVDIILEPYVKKTFKKHFVTGLEWLGELVFKKESKDFESDFESMYGKIEYENTRLRNEFKKVYTFACSQTEKSVYNAMQSYEYEINTVYNSSGQTPFHTLGFGRGLSWESRLIQIAILKVRIKGLGKNHDTAIFPKLIYAMNEGVNKNEKDPNYDITLLAQECSIKRIYPDMVSVPLVEKVTGNFKFPMGCRSFLSKYVNEDGEEINYGRMNLGVTTVNLPRLAILAKGDINKFYSLLDKYCEIAKDSMMVRINRLRNVKANVAPILYCEGATGFRLNPDDNIFPIFKNGYATVSLGYIGLHETILALFGKAMYKDENLKVEGKKIIEFLKNKTVEWKEKTGFGFSLYGTPSESLTDRFCKLDKKEFGVIKGITDKGFYNNSFHFDVEQNINAMDKIEFEKDFPFISSGGFIDYVELPSLKNNPKSLGDIWNFAYDKVPYFGVNMPNDRCFECGFQGEFPNKNGKFVCPHCGNDNQYTLSIIRRLCGYLGQLSLRQPAEGRLKEVCSRIKHVINDIDSIK